MKAAGASGVVRSATSCGRPGTGRHAPPSLRPRFVRRRAAARREEAAHMMPSDARATARSHILLDFSYTVRRPLPASRHASFYDVSADTASHACARLAVPARTLACSDDDFRRREYRPRLITPASAPHHARPRRARVAADTNIFLQTLSDAAGALHFVSRQYFIYNADGRICFRASLIHMP